MTVKLESSTLRRTRWYEYVLRFLFGGLITSVAGIIAHRFGPIVGGLFLAFPAIFPATATLIEKHEKQKKQEKGLAGDRGGQEAAALEAAGTALGSLGLIIFAALVWKLLPSHQHWLILISATVAWAVASALFWKFRIRT